jgi:predicted Fe-Mo cluster-binding NifX family protein
VLHFAVMASTEIAFCEIPLGCSSGNSLFLWSLIRLVRQMLTPFAMRIAIPHWQGRIAPVFDVARHLLLVDVEDGGEIRRQEKPLTKADPLARAAELAACGADMLICGAISAPLQLRIAASGVRVVAFLCGTVDEVLSAYLHGTLADPRLAMPGCRMGRAAAAGATASVRRGRTPSRLRPLRRPRRGPPPCVGSINHVTCPHSMQL